MKNKELFTLNPEENNLINDGVVEINTAIDEKGLQIIYHELKTFVCEGEYQRGLHRILQTYLKYLDEPKQPSVWVSGFFGSGKSHLIKILGYLWEDFKFPNDETARSIKQLPDDVNDLIVELNRKQKVFGRLSISGTLKDFPSADIRYSFLQLFLNKLDLPAQYHHFKFVYWAKQEGIYDDLKAIIESQGKSFKHEYENLFVSSALAKAVLELKPEFAENEAKVKENFKANFRRIDSINRDQFIHCIKNEILPMFFGDKIPLTIIVLDEVQQFIGNDSDKSIDVQNLEQDISSNFDGKFLLVGTGQNALSETSLLQRLQARFTVNVNLSDTDVETVTRKTVLEKKPSVIKPLDQILEGALGEISRNLSGTDFAYVTSDRSMLVADYPILPSTRKFWKKILQVIDTAGTSGQLRSQLRIVDESIKKVANKDAGNIVPADLIFEQKQAQLLQNALLLNDTNNLIVGKKSKTGDSLLEGRILSVIFLIEQLPKDGSGSRIKSNETTIAELLLDNIVESSDAFRSKIKGLIKKLVDENVLMVVGDEFKLQTKVGAEWEKEYTTQAVKLNNSGDDLIQGLRNEKIIYFFRDKTKAVKILHGNSKQIRDFEIWDKAERPITTHKLNVWIRDGWNENESTVLNEIREEGADAPLAYAYVKKFRDQDLRSAIIQFLAAEKTLDAKGQPSSPEEEQARKSMETRKGLAKIEIEDLIGKICLESVVYLSGGTKVEAGTIKDNIEEALHSIADRQFPDFKGKADYKDWDKALGKALQGDPDALKKIGWDKEPKDHPVAIEILRFIGNGTKQGKEIRNHFIRSPYGWSQDAIDTIILLLRNTEHISTLEPDLNQARIGNAAFKKEIHTLTASDKIKIRRIYMDAGITCQPGQEFLHSNTYLNQLKTLAESIGGDAPKPEPVNIQFLKDIENLDGNERLLRILDEQEDLKAKYKDWKQKAALIEKREPNWSLLVDLANYANSGESMERLKKEIDAIRDNRLLLQEPDPVYNKLTDITDKLKTSLNELKQKYIDLYDKLMVGLQSNEYFSKLNPEQKNSILRTHQLLGKPEIKALDSKSLLLNLQKASLEAWQTKIAALPGQFQSAIDDAVKLLAPQAKTYELPKRTLSNQSDIDKYISQIKKELENLLKESSSIILK